MRRVEPVRVGGAALPIVAPDDVVGLFAPPSDREGGGL
ncbi:hypothetical protein ACVW0K_000086 [Streptomyces filamentosus]